MLRAYDSAGRLDDGDILPPLPHLASSVSEDEDDNGYSEHHHEGRWQKLDSGYQSLTDEESLKALELDAHLQRYETMLRHQYAEDIATVSHLAPLLTRVEQLAHNKSKSCVTFKNDVTAVDVDVMRAMSYADVHFAVKMIDGGSSKDDLLPTDKQLMLVLRTIAQSLDDYAGHEDFQYIANQMITWGEIIQCYKICIASMQVLEKIPFPQDVRTRVRDRSLSVLSLFRANGKRTDASTVTGMLTDDRTLATVNRNITAPSSKKKFWRSNGAVVVFFLCFLLAAIGCFTRLFWKKPEITAVRAMDHIDSPTSNVPARQSPQRARLSRSLARTRCFEIYRDPVYTRRAMLLNANRNVYKNTVSLVSTSNTSVDFESPLSSGIPGVGSSAPTQSQSDSEISDSKRSKILVTTLVSTIVGGSTAGLLVSNISVISASVAPVLTFGVAAILAAIISNDISSSNGWLRRLMSWLKKN